MGQQVYANCLENIMRCLSRILKNRITFLRQPEVPSIRFAYENLFSDAKYNWQWVKVASVTTVPKLIHRAAKNIHRYVPESRLIYMVRNPISRIESDWRMRMHERRVPCSINEAVVQQKNLIEIGKYWKNLTFIERCSMMSRFLLFFSKISQKIPKMS